GLGLTVHADVGGDIGEEPGAGVSAGGVQDTVAKDLSDSTTGKGANMGIMGVNDPELTNKNVILTNGGSGTVITDNDIKVKVEFNVPVYGDFLNDDGSIMDGAAYFVKDDTVTLLLSEHFKFDPEPSASINLNYFDGTETITLGTVTLSNNESDQAQANIIFNGPEGIFSPEDTIIYSGVSAWFDASLKHNGRSTEDEDGNKTVAILDKTFQLKLPEDEKHYTVEKSVKDGAVDLVNGTIKWTVTITATQGVGGSNHIDLGGYVFEDDLQSVGGYVENSFSPTGDTLEVPNESSTFLKYTFPAGTKSPQTLTFKTYIPNAEYTNGGTVENSAGLRVDNVTFIPSNKATATIPSLSVEKDAQVTDGFTENKANYNPKDRTITWSIKVNYDGRTLDNLKITDQLPAGLEFESAAWYKWDSDTNTWETNATITWNEAPAEGVYSIGTVDSTGQLVIVSKVPNEFEEGSVNLKTYTNQASVAWKGEDGTSGSATSNEKGVNIGYDAIKKEGTQEDVDISNHQITWTINVDLKGQSFTDFVVYDLFVHDGATTDADLTSAVAWPSEDLTIEGTTNNIKGITRNNGQKFISSVPEANDTNTNSPQVDTVELYKGSDHIATLVKISNLSTTDMNTVVLKSQVIDPNIIAGNSPSQTVRNTASLYKGDTYRGKDYADVNYNNKILAKEMLKREEVTHDHNHNQQTIGANNKATSLTDAFNYNYKEVIFRLNINAAGIDFGSVQTNLNGGFGDVVVTDTLPLGWEFVNFSSGAQYLIYNANQLAFGDAVSLTATGQPLQNLAGLTASFNNPENSPHTATFTFASPNLNKPYVILLKARPTDPTFEGYLLGDKNKIEETNLLNLKSANWELGKEVKQKVEFDSKLIDKTLDTTKQSEGVLTWIVDYT
ncbi:MAG: hypothetical protein GX777_01135, partial [Fastidiosipila sp.]|nr:hypothetical protein [Fastidiosipila sp.]